VFSLSSPADQKRPIDGSGPSVKRRVPHGRCSPGIVPALPLAATVMPPSEIVKNLLRVVA